MRKALLVFGLMLNSLAATAECTVRSGPHANALVELYTSEGCSSCPPADRWLSSLAAAAATGRVVPLAFHVDYWDHIGWRDPFASPRGTARQRELQRMSGARYVYTPQVTVGGRDFPGWRGGAAPAALEAIQRKAPRARIELAIKADPAGGVEVVSTTALDAASAPPELAVVVALTQNGLASRVTAGENRGERLSHDFVVRDFTMHRGVGRATSLFKAAPGWNPANMSVAAFVQDVRTGEVLQALAARLCQ